MTLTVGTTRGHYEVLGSLGAGGMGEVYRARDTKLGREVALKVLPDSVAHDSERLARFRREAQVLASLNHPHIAQIYGLEDAGGMLALAMEFAPGADLSERLKHGPLPVADTRAIAIQIAEALAAAHEYGIVHRDLKPANVKVGEDGAVKVLDFGLAKAIEPETGAASRPGALSDSPTITSPAFTARGMILGTAAYMAPEQAKGQRVDKRADIWAFGCVLYEMLTGRRAFQGQDVSEVMASVLAREPNLQELPADTSPAMRTVVERCLVKDRKERMADISIALFLLRDAAATSPPRAVAPAPPRARTGLLVVGAAVCLAAGAALAVVALPVVNRPAAAEPTRTSLLVPADRPIALSNATPATLLAISPNGTTVAYVSLNASAPVAQRRQITVRSLGSLATRDLPGTFGAYQPFFSPDGAWLAFFANGELKKVPLSGGNPVTIASKLVSSTFAAGVWIDADTIVFGGIGTSLRRIAADGSGVKELTPFDAAQGEDRHLPTSFVPEAHAVLFRTRESLHAFDLQSGTRRLIVDTTSFGTAAGGHLLFRRDDSVLVAPFDRKGLTLTGTVVPFADDVMFDGQSSNGYTPQVAVSANGTLAYVPVGNLAALTLGTVLRDGTFAPMGVESGRLSRPRVSPDGERVIFVRASGGTNALELYNVARGTTTTLLKTERSFPTPVWRPPDGRQIATGMQRSGVNGIYLVEPGGNEQLLLKADASVTAMRPESFSPDGRVLAYTVQQNGRFDIWTLQVDDPSTARPLMASPVTKHSPQFSPDGGQLAYVTTESGRAEVYVRGYPRGDVVQVSSTGATGPMWSHDGRTLFFETTAASSLVLMSVSVAAAGDRLAVGTPALVLHQRVPVPSGGVEQYIQGGVWGAEYDVFRDGRFVMVRGGDPQGAREIVLVQHWFDELNRLAPGK